MTETAPWFPVPSKSVVAVEHPCIVKKVDRSIDMIGGPNAISESVEPGSNATLSLKFHPENPETRTVMSFNNHNANNVLLKITVPKRTGRKRKRGTDEWIIDTESPRDASYALKSLRDNPDSEVEVLGTVKSVHVWRAMPDFVYSDRGSKFLQGIKDKIMPQQYPLLKQWSMPKTYGLTDTESIRPPVFSTQTMNQNYSYRQNPAVKTVAEPGTGNKVLFNTQAPIKVHTVQCQWNMQAFPTQPPPSCPRLADQPLMVRNLVGVMGRIFEERPILTRRFLVNSLPDDQPTHLARYAAAYHAFAIRSGPWRDTYCKFGVDPRTNRKYRFYQTIMLQQIKGTEAPESTSWTRNKNKNSHIFTGESKATFDGATWQLCDLHDPQLKPLIDLPDALIRAECESRYFGWYPNGANSKLRTALKAKVDAILEGQSLDIVAMDRFLALPDHWDPDTQFGPDGQQIDPTLAYLPRESSKKELEWASAYRTFCRTKQGELPASGGWGKGRLSKPKPDARPNFISEDPDDGHGSPPGLDGINEVDNDMDEVGQVEEDGDDGEDLSENSEDKAEDEAEDEDEDEEDNGEDDEGGEEEEGEDPETDMDDLRANG